MAAAVAVKSSEGREEIFGIAAGAGGEDWGGGAGPDAPAEVSSLGAEEPLPFPFAFVAAGLGFWREGLLPFLPPAAAISDDESHRWAATPTDKTAGVAVERRETARALWANRTDAISRSREDGFLRGQSSHGPGPGPVPAARVAQSRLGRSFRLVALVRVLYGALRKLGTDVHRVHVWSIY